MDNFDLKKYLAEGKLLKEINESVYTDPNTGKNYDLQYVSSKNRWEMDITKKDSSIYDKITTIKRDHIDDIIDWLEGYNIDSSWVIPAEGKLYEEAVDNGPEEKAFDTEFQNAANQIAATIGKELKDKKAENPEALNEAIITSAIAAILTGNAVLGFISKMSAKLMKKLNWKKGEDFAEKIHHWAHDNEKSFQEPIRRVLAFFIKDKAKLELVVKAIYAIVIGSMAAGYGANALSSLEKADWFNSSLSALKTLAKSDEAIVNAFPAIKSLIT